METDHCYILRNRVITWLKGSLRPCWKFVSSNTHRTSMNPFFFRDRKKQILLLKNPRKYNVFKCYVYLVDRKPCLFAFLFIQVLKKSWAIRSAHEKTSCCLHIFFARLLVRIEIFCNGPHRPWDFFGCRRTPLQRKSPTEIVWSERSVLAQIYVVTYELQRQADFVGE